MTRRPGADVVLAVVLPLACAGALLLVHPDRDQPTGASPVDAALSSATVICPSAVGGSDAVGVTSLAGDTADGDVSVGLGAAATPLRVRAHRLADATPPDGSAVLVTGAGDLAPGLVAGRSAAAPLAAVGCTAAHADQWFTAVGAAATHDSVLQLVNPNAGVAVADITVRSPGGELDVPALRGVSVEGGATTNLDLGAVVPRRGELSLEVHTSRGRLAAYVVDTYDQLGAGARAQDWLPPQPGPATSNLLLGVVKGAGERTLALSNAGDSEVRASVQVLTATSTFAPTGVEEIRVPPGSTEAVSLDDVLQQAADQGATGLVVTSTGPVTATLRQFVDGDLSLLAATPAGSGPMAAVVPAGTQRLLLAAPKAGATGTATVTAYAAGGKALLSQPVDLVPGGGADVALPAGTALVSVTPDGTSVHGAVLVAGAGTGTAVVPLDAVVLAGAVPDVRPGRS